MRTTWEFGYVSLNELLDWVREHPLPTGRPVPICLWGARGIGKTQQVKSYCDTRGLRLRTYHPAHDQKAADIVGVQYIDEETKRTVYARPAWLPIADKDEHGEWVWADPEDAAGGIIFIDEINRANHEVLQGLMEPIGEGTISQSEWDLPPGWSIVCAANPNEKGYQVTPMDAAMVNRMLHYAPGWNAPGWVRWADSVNLHPTVVNFALQSPDLIETGEAELPIDVNQTASARTLEYLAALYTEDIEMRMLHTCARGLLGNEAAEAILSQHVDDEVPLDPLRVLQGDFAEELERWESERRLDLIRATTTRVAAVLQPLHPDPDDVRAQRAAEGFGLWLQSIPQDLIPETISILRESIPDWLEIMLDNDSSGELRQRIPDNPARIRRDRRTQARQRRERSDVDVLAQKISSRRRL